MSSTMSSTAKSGSSELKFIVSSAGFLIRAWIAGGFSHRPGTGHVVPDTFSGICVAPSSNPDMNKYMLDRLQELGVGQVRMDYTYNSAEFGADDFLEALLDAGFAVCLHLVQPFDEVAAMDAEPAQERWRDFVRMVTDRWGRRLEIIEVGSTVNRRRWAGYSVSGFFQAWAIAWQILTDAGVAVAGPNVSDFEPVYNAGVLASLQRARLLPKVHTDNLFVERVSQPEVYDHRIAGRRAGNWLKFNTIKKASFLQKIGERHGVPEFWCSHVTWTAPRIYRVLEDTDQKQADYLSRYFLLAAASGALQRVYWGAFVCRSAGLIDDGTGRYPDHERVTLYEESYGTPETSRIRPAFKALQAVARLLSGQRYDGVLSDTSGLKAHAFVGETYRFHALWTLNGRAAALASLYPAGDLAKADCLTRDGELVTDRPDFVTESPIFLRWPVQEKVGFSPGNVIEHLAIHSHETGFHHYAYDDGGYTGLVLARSPQERDCLLDAIAPEKLMADKPSGFLRHARNAVWEMADPRDANRALVVKQPVKLRFHKKLYERFRPPKALQSWSGASELRRRGLDTPRPVAWFARGGKDRLTSNFFVCEFQPGCVPLRKLLNNYTRGKTMHPTITPDELFPQLCAFVKKMHHRGVFFRDLSSGNILVRKEAGELCFTLVDTGRARFYPKISLAQRLADLKRLCYKLDANGRERFMLLYLGKRHEALRRRYRRIFLYYDLKVGFKRLLQGRSWRKR